MGKIAIRGFKEIKVYDQKDIVFCHSEGRYTFIHFSDESEMITARQLKCIEDKLSAKDFCRIHNSYLVNINYIKSIRDHIAILINNIELPIAKRRNKFLLDSMKEHDIELI